MKRIILLVAIIMIPAMCIAASKKDSGNKELNKYLHQLSQDVASGQLSSTELRTHVDDSFGVKADAYKVMERNKLEGGEKYLVGLIHKASDVKVTKIVNRYRGGRRAWKDVIYYYGTTPNELNDMRVADQKKWKKSRKKLAKKSKVAKGSSSKTQALQKRMMLTTADEICECECKPKGKRRK